MAQKSLNGKFNNIKIPESYKRIYDILGFINDNAECSLYQIYTTKKISTITSKQICSFLKSSGLIDISYNKRYKSIYGYKLSTTVLGKKVYHNLKKIGL